MAATAAIEDTPFSQFAKKARNALKIKNFQLEEPARTSLRL
jgi:hypothetical protein